MKFKQFEADLDCIAILNSIRSLQASVFEIQSKTTLIQDDSDKNLNLDCEHSPSHRKNSEEEKQSLEERNKTYK